MQGDTALTCFWLQRFLTTSFIAHFSLIWRHRLLNETGPKLLAYTTSYDNYVLDTTLIQLLTSLEAKIMLITRSVRPSPGQMTGARHFRSYFTSLTEPYVNSWTMYAYVWSWPPLSMRQWKTRSSAWGSEPDMIHILVVVDALSQSSIAASIRCACLYRSPSFSVSVDAFLLDYFKKYCIGNLSFWAVQTKQRAHWTVQVPALLDEIILYMCKVTWSPDGRTDEQNYRLV